MDIFEATTSKLFEPEKVYIKCEYPSDSENENHYETYDKFEMKPKDAEKFDDRLKIKVESNMNTSILHEASAIINKSPNDGHDVLSSFKNIEQDYVKIKGNLKIECKHEKLADVDVPCVGFTVKEERDIDINMLNEEFDIKNEYPNEDISMPKIICEETGINTSHFAVNNLFIDTKPHTCDVCNKNFTYVCQLIAHKRSHTGEKPYTCDVCSKKYFTKNDMLRHQRIHTGEKPYKCDVCNKEFSTNNTLVKHKRIHTGEKPYVCGVCNQGFADSGSFGRQKRIHTGEKPYICDVCEKGFTTKGSFKVHVRVHTGEKPYICDICNKKFKQISHLVRHKLIHNAEKLHICYVCSQGFPNIIALTKHKTTHTVEKPYTCDVCNKRFSAKKSLKHHKSIHTKKMIT